MTGMADKPDNQKTFVAFQQALAALRDGFAKKISSKVEEIHQSWERLKAAPEDGRTFHLLHRQAHTLAGTAATYGFEEVGRLAREIELILQAKLAEDHFTWTKTTVDQVDVFLVKLKKIAREKTFKASSDTEASQTADAASLMAEMSEHIIYLVDDDVDLLKTTKAQIQAFGYDVEAFSDLNQFDKAIERQTPAVVIMDVMFGEGKKTGIEHIADINATRKHPLQSIFITNKHDVLTRLKAVRANGLAFFPKPVLVEQLIDVLNGLNNHGEEDAYKVVIVDDSEEQSAFAALHLQQAGMETCEVNDPLELLHTLADFSPDIILMDLYMPDCDGFELSKVIRQMDAYVSIPIVFLSTEQNREKQMGAMSLGGDDFLSKPIEPWHLISAVSSRVQRGRMIRKLAETDGLTGLLTHSKSKERLAVELSRAIRERSPLSFVMLDIDHFKHVNDTYGHPAGDRVLKSLANMLKQRLRQYDIIGRYGGEEFVLVLPNTDAEMAKIVLDTLRVTFSEIGHSSDDGPFHCTFSCGIASCPEFDRIISLNHEADQALYKAKKNGRNQVLIAKKTH